MSVVYPDFDGCQDATGGGPGVPANLRTNVVPIGAINGVNTVFTTPDDYVHDGVTDERVYLRGQRLRQGVGHDYLASESGGAGTGYDTITFAKAPRPGDNILLDYYIDAP